MNITMKISKDFIESIKIGNFEQVKSSFEEAKSNFDLKYFNKEDKYGLKPIHWACLSSNIEIIEWMLQKKCNIETSSRNGWRPIHFASYVKNVEMVEFLIKNFCKLNCETDNGETILDVANGNCNHEFIDELFSENINWKIGISMGLKCGPDCNHRFCLSSLIQSNFRVEEHLGCGVFSSVYEVEYGQNDKLFAVKIIKISDYNLSANAKCILPNINQFLPNLEHRKLIKCFGMVKTAKKMNLYMESMSHGTLRDAIEIDGTLDIEKIRQYSEDILEAIEFLHSKKILHGNVCPKNIFIDKKSGGCKLSISNFTCSLADGGIQINYEKDDNWKSEYSCYPFRAPEIFQNELLSYPFDIFCLGCTLIEMSKGDYLQYRWNFIDEIYDIISEISNQQLRSFIKSMVMKNPYERASILRLLDDEFIINASIDISIDDIQSINNNSIDLLQNAIDNKQIGVSMKLKCDAKCQHGFCLSSVTATNFKKGEYIGEGMSGKVYKIKINYGMYWAMKIIRNVVDENIKEEAKQFRNNMNKYRETINHENIVKYYGAIRNLKKTFIFMEFIDGESLYQKIKKNDFNPLRLVTIKHYTKNILEGLNYLHNLDIIHQNITSANILISINKNVAKISDFGMSQFLNTLSKKQRKIFYGTPNYMAPEVINDEPFDCSADIWSLGATVFEMASGHPPYHDIEENCSVIFIIGITKKIKYPPIISDDIKNLLDLMMNVDPEKRSTAESLLGYGFIN